MRAAEILHRSGRPKHSIQSRSLRRWAERGRRMHIKWPPCGRGRRPEGPEAREQKGRGKRKSWRYAPPSARGWTRRREEGEETWMIHRLVWRGTADYLLPTAAPL